MKPNKIIPILLLLFIFIYLKDGFAIQKIDYIGSYTCYNSSKHTPTAKFLILKKGSARISKGSLKDIYTVIKQNYILVQEIKGTCSLNDKISLKLEKPIPALLLLDLLVRLYDFQYFIDADAIYTPSYIMLYEDNLSLDHLIRFLRKKIENVNKGLILEIDFTKKVLALSREKTIPLLTSKQKENRICKPLIFPNYVDICSKNYCVRYGIIWNEEQYELLKEYSNNTFIQRQNSFPILIPFIECKKNKPTYVVLPKKCKGAIKIQTLYLSDIDLTSLLKIVESLLNIHFLYSEEELSKIRGAQHIHLVLKCLTEKKIVSYLKRTFHLYIEPVTEHVYKIIPDRDAYSVVLQKVSDYISKVFYIRGITLEDFVKILENRYGDKVIYSADPTFNAVTVIGPPDLVRDIERTLGVYIRNSSAFDNLISKIFYVKFGDINQIVEKIKNYLSEKGTVKILNEARAIEITDYPTNISMVEKVFGKFLSQKPVKIKVSVKFVRINKVFTRNLGIQWSFTYSGTGTAESIRSWTENFNSGVLTSSIQFSYRKLNPIFLQIAAAESLSLAKTLSNPSLVLLNGQSGNISSGVQIPYQAVDQNGNPTTNLVSASLTLNVTPQLLPDGRILLKIQLSKDSPNTRLTVNEQPSINTFTITQNFIVANGETFIIGGVVERTNNTSETGTPILRNIPLLGWLFKNKNWDNNEDELMVFITAKVVSE